jgi:hypothetical protein
MHIYIARSATYVRRRFSTQAEPRMVVLRIGKKWTCNHAANVCREVPHFSTFDYFIPERVMSKNPWEVFVQGVYFHWCNPRR